MSPSGSPIASEKTTAIRTTSSAVRAPYTTRESTSVDWTFVPNKCSDDGACCFTNRAPSAVRYSSKSYGAIHGAKSAITTKSRVIRIPAQTTHFGTPWASRIGATMRPIRAPTPLRAGRGSA